MRPLVLTTAGAALGLAVLLPAARAHVSATDRSAAVVVAASSARGRATTAVVTGPAVAARYGPVQVQVTTGGGRVTDVRAVQLPDADGESRRINRDAAPLLRAAALTAQDAHIDTVSGASWTSGGYRRSLQAALDLARALPPAG